MSTNIYVGNLPFRGRYGIRVYLMHGISTNAGRPWKLCLPPPYLAVAESGLVAWVVDLLLSSRGFSPSIPPAILGLDHTVGHPR
jgi:hypothetical protein